MVVIRMRRMIMEERRKWVIFLPQFCQQVMVMVRCGQDPQ